MRVCVCVCVWVSACLCRLNSVLPWVSLRRWMWKHSATCFETIITWLGCGLANVPLSPHNDLVWLCVCLILNWFLYRWVDERELIEVRTEIVQLRFISTVLTGRKWIPQNRKFARLFDTFLLFFRSFLTICPCACILFILSCVQLLESFILLFFFYSRTRFKYC